ncbi:MAG: DUF4012 domain-containing protein [Patescibacteria group bacterium]|nr:DUF4012 domain-containing protein [Patescibacteria group bacterium]
MDNPARNVQTTQNLEEVPAVLITGAAGCLGSFLVEKIDRLSCRIFGFDNFTAGTKKNLADCLTSPDFNFCEKNLNDSDLPDYIEQKTGRVSYIFHLAKAAGTLSLLEIARKSQAKFLLLSDSSLASKEDEALVTKYYQNYNLNSRIVRIRDVYGPRISRNNNDNSLPNLLINAFNNRVLNIYGNGLFLYYPVYVADAIEGIMAAMFGTDTAGHIFNLYNPEEITALSLVKKLQPHLPHELEIIFANKGNLPVGKKSSVRLDETFGWKPQKNLEEGLYETVRWLSLEPVAVKQAQKILPENEKETEKIVPVSAVVETSGSFWQRIAKFFPKISRSGAHTVLFRTKFQFRAILLVLTAFLLVFWPIFSLMLNSFWAVNNLKSGQSLIVSGSLEQAAKKIKNSRNNWQAARSDLEKSGWMFNLAGKQDGYNNWDNFFNLAQKASDGLGHLIMAGNSYQKAAKVVLGDGGGVLARDLAEGLSQLKISDDDFSRLAAEFNTNSAVIPAPDWLKNLTGIKRLQDKLNVYLPKFLTYVRYLSQARLLAESSPAILGLNGKQTYLLLFANNMELRPAGGFIGSYGLLTFENGKMDLKVQDVYSADGRLSGHVEPPVPIRKYLNQPHWYLRDSNWSPDFRESASRAEWFLEKEVGQKVDGTILFDLSAAQNLLQVLGPVYLDDYKVKVDSSNLFALASKYSEKNFFPGSSQKRDFLGALAGTLLVNLKQNFNQKGPGLMLAFFTSLEDKHLSLYFHDQILENSLNQYGLGGAVGQDPCLGLADCYGDYLMVVDANLGVNKVNYYVRENLNQKIVIDNNGQVRENLTLTYQNNSPDQNWPGGTYTDFVRILLPAGSLFGNLQIDGVDAGYKLGPLSLNGKIAPGTTEIDQSTESGKIAYGLLISVLPQTTKTVSISYNLGPSLTDGPRTIYRLLVQKQLGSIDNSYQLEADFPDAYQVRTNLKNADVKKNSLIYSQSLNKDSLLEWELIKINRGASDHNGS